jgi:hypothetical protein
MPPHLPKAFDAARSNPGSRSGRERDIVWDRPVFRAPLLPNPRIIFDPLPFTAQRLTDCRRPAH